MADITDVFTAVKARIASNTPGGVTMVKYQNDDVQLPDTPAVFAYVELITEPGKLVGFGGGPGANLYRNPGLLIFYVFAPLGEGLETATGTAEAFAALFRSYRDSVISCHAATVMPIGNGSLMKPPGLQSEVGNYWCAVTEVSLTFDQVG